MGRSRAWVAAAIGLLVAALIGMHVLSAPPAMAMPGDHAHRSSDMAPAAGPALTTAMSSCGQHPCVSHRLASTPVPHAAPAQAVPTVAAGAPARLSGLLGTSHRARPPPRAGGGAGLGVWRQ
ncbi:MAG TPA: hypothetical protein VJ872_02085 [Nocardioides sp.]|nr:hypothetical protein [Nocardioides sp.]